VDGPLLAGWAEVADAAEASGVQAIPEVAHELTADTCRKHRVHMVWISSLFAMK
jgi:hypothetical protein